VKKWNDNDHNNAVEKRKNEQMEDEQVESNEQDFVCIGEGTRGRRTCGGMGVVTQANVHFME
jgi:hypothetical protein